MGFSTRAKELIKALVEPDEMIDIDEMTDKQREDILKYEEGYKEFCKTDSVVKSSEQSVKDYTNLIKEAEKAKRKTLNIDKVLTKNQRNAMEKYYQPQEEKEKQEER